MNNNLKKYIQLTFVLFFIATLSGSILAYVNEITKDRIAQIRIDKINNNMSSFFTEIKGKQIEENGIAEYVKDQDDLTKEAFSEYKVNENILSIYEVIDEQNTVLGYMFEVKAPGSYNGQLSLLVGVDVTGEIKGFNYLTYGETGPGATVKEQDGFIEQFNGKTDVYYKSKTNKNVDIVSGATYTSTSTIKGIDICLDFYNENLKD